MQRNVLWLLVAVVLLAGAILVTTGGDGDDRVASSAVVGGDLHSLVVDPNDSDRLFLGGHQAVSVSTDGGVTWRRVPSLEDKDAMGWGFIDGTVYVSGHPGLNRSTDGGKTFTTINEGLPDTDVHAFGAGREVLYGASPAVGVFASHDGGDSWTIRIADTGRAFFGRILVDPSDEDQLLAADAQSGVVASRDGGRTWQTVGPLPSATWISAVGESHESILASGPAGVALSTDGGGAWQPLELPGGAFLAEFGHEPGTIYAAAHTGTSAGLFVSRDGGRTWSRPA